MKSAFLDRNSPIDAVRLLMAPDQPVKGGMVFCPVCGAGGTYKSVIEEGGALTPNCFTAEQVTDFRKQLGV